MHRCLLSPGRWRRAACRFRTSCPTARSSSIRDQERLLRLTSKARTTSLPRARSGWPRPTRQQSQKAAFAEPGRRRRRIVAE